MTIWDQELDKPLLAKICRKYGVSKLSLFGSMLRADFDPLRSDVDLLVEYIPGQHKSLFKLLTMERELTELFGRRVDLSTAASLSKYFRDEVAASAQVIYDAA